MFSRRFSILACVLCLINSANPQSPSLAEVLGLAPSGTSGTGTSDLNNAVGSILGNTFTGTTTNMQPGLDGPTMQTGTVPSLTQNTGMQQPPVTPYCSGVEVRTLFDNCAMAFGMAHMRYFQYLSSQPTCRAEVFDCGVVDNFVRCVNSQPVSTISNRCWYMVRDVLTSFLRRYSLPCTFDNVYQQCHRRSQDIMPVEQRPQTGMGVNNNPMSYILPIIRQWIPLITMLMSGGGGMFAF